MLAGLTVARGSGGYLGAMEQSPNGQREYGALENATVWLFALSAIFSLITWIPGIVCLTISKCWTTSEKLIAVFAPTLIVLALAFTFGNIGTVQNWIRIPLMITLAGFDQLAAAAYLYIRARNVRTEIATPA
jgi:hypothetical protein